MKFSTLEFAWGHRELIRYSFLLHVHLDRFLRLQMVDRCRFLKLLEFHVWQRFGPSLVSSSGLLWSVQFHLQDIKNKASMTAYNNSPVGNGPQKSMWTVCQSTSIFNVVLIQATFKSLTNRLCERDLSSSRVLMAIFTMLEEVCLLITSFHSAPRPKIGVLVQE